MYLSLPPQRLQDIYVTMETMLHRGGYSFYHKCERESVHVMYIIVICQRKFECSGKFPYIKFHEHPIRNFQAVLYKLTDGEI